MLVFFGNAGLSMFRCVSREHSHGARLLEPLPFVVCGVMSREISDLVVRFDLGSRPITSESSRNFTSDHLRIYIYI